MKNSLIWIYDNALSPEFCKSVISKFESDSRKHEGQSGYKVRREIKRSTDLSITPLDDWKEYDEVFCKSLDESILKYYDYIDTLIEPFPKINPEEYIPKLSTMIEGTFGNVFDTGYQIQKTEPGGFYEWHHDSILEYSSLTNNTPQLRYITFIWYLNDVFHDGYTEFLNGDRVQPKEGRLVLFPATWDMFHRGYPPKCETKYICTGWIWYNIKLGEDVCTIVRGQ